MTVGTLEAILELRDKMSPGLMQAAKNLDQLSTTFTQAGAALLPVSAAIGGLGFMAIKAAGDFEQTKIGFTTMLGSAKAADAFLKEMRDFAAATPFEFPDLVRASQRMLALGFAAKDIKPMLTTIGDAAAGLGSGAEGINGITLALGQMQAKGKVSAQEMNQLAERGIGAWQMLAKAIGTSVPEAMKRAEAGTITAAQAIPAILAGMNEKFGGMMKAQSATLLGQISTLKDEFTFVVRDLGVALLPIATSILEGFQSMLPPLRDAVAWFGNLGSTSKIVIVSFAAFVAALGPLLMILGAVAGSISAVITLYTTMTAAGAVLGSGLLSMVGSFVAAQGGAAALSLSLVTLLAQVAAGAAAFAIGWQIGTWIRDLTGLGEAADKAATALFALWKGENSEISQGVDITKTWTAEQKAALAAFKATQPALADHAAGVKATTPLTKEAEAALKKFRTEVAALKNELTGGKAADELKKLEAALKGLDIMKLPKTSLEKAVKDLREYMAMGAAPKDSLKGLGEALKLVGESDARLKNEGIKLLTEAAIEGIPVNTKYAESLKKLVNEGITPLQAVVDSSKGNIPVKIVTPTKEATKATFDWAKALDNLKNVMQVLGIESDSTFGRIVGGLTVAAQSGQQFKAAMTNADGTMKSLGKMDWGAMAQAAATFFAAVVSGARSSASALEQVFFGTTSGASFGSAFGPKGAAAGAAFGAAFTIGASDKIGTLPKIAIAALFPVMAAGEALGAVFSSIFGGGKKKAEEMTRALEEQKAAEEALKAAAQAHADSIDQVKAAMDRYGISVEEMGPKWAQQQLDERAMQLLQDYRMLTAAMDGHTDAIAKMGPEMSKYVQQCIAAGVLIPKSLQPAIEQMIKMGVLTDADGKKIDSIDGKMFSESMTDAVTRVIQKIDELVNALLGITPPNIVIPLTWSDPGPPPTYGLGGLPLPPPSPPPPGGGQGGGGLGGLGGLGGQNAIPAASGLDAVASRPTLILAGERGPERVTVTREGQSLPGGAGGSGMSTAAMERHLSSMKDELRAMPEKNARALAYELMKMRRVG